MDIQAIAHWFLDNKKLLVQYGLNITSAIIILLVGWLVAKWVTKYSKSIMGRRELDATTTGFVSTVIHYGVVVLTLIVALGNLGFKTAPLITMIGAAGIAVGLALQNSLSNFAAGLILIIFRPVSVGDYIEVSGKSGTILAISIISTTLKEANGFIHTIPNNAMVNSAVSNLTENPTRRTEIIIGVGYESDIQTVKKILTDIVTSQSNILIDDGIVIELDNLGSSSLDFIIRYWTKVSDVQLVKWAVLAEIKEKLDAAGIDIPFNTLNVHLEKS